jgi:hypothetical protein
MQKWIQHDGKPLGHSNYIEIITQIYRSNNFFSDFGQMSLEKIVEEESFHRMFRLRKTLRCCLTVLLNNFFCRNLTTQICMKSFFYYLKSIFKCRNHSSYSKTSRTLELYRGNYIRYLCQRYISMNFDPL